MLPINMISAFQGAEAFSTKTIDPHVTKNKYIKLKPQEATCLSKLYGELKSYSSDFKMFDGYFVGYSIKQISKEFDLLRFSDFKVINIELKSELDEEDKLVKITTQMIKNEYYLKVLNRSVSIYTYVENDGLYKYNNADKTCECVEIEELAKELQQQNVNLKINPDELFVPSNYLVSPFNHVERFLNSEYFLTDRQQEIKNNIVSFINKNEYRFFSISANAGTGKTLALYDTAKEIIKTYGLKSALIIHCGKLNSGHLKLKNTNHWNIHSIADVRTYSIKNLVQPNLKAIFIDESQRIDKGQLSLIIEQSKTHTIPIIFSYDINQYLKDGETLDLHKYISAEYPDIPAIKYTLTNKIRTNHEIASFITNLFDSKKSNSYLNYQNVSVECFNDLHDVKQYIDYLEKHCGWKAIKYSTKRYGEDYLDNISSICSASAHDVIGQEFEKIVLVMDKNFKYNDEGKLLGRASLYNAKGMLYQMVTRVVSELKIIVLDNPDLYYKLLQIKSLGDKNCS